MPRAGAGPPVAAARDRAGSDPGRDEGGRKGAPPKIGQIKMINVSDPHSPRSLVLALFGAYAHHLPSPVPVRELVRLLAAVDVDASSARSTVTRLKRRGLLHPARTPQGAGYEPAPATRELLEDWRTRAYATAEPREDDGWVLAVFSVPESQRQKRYLLRSRLASLGFGTTSPGVWIGPAPLHRQARHTLRRLGLDRYVELFRGEHLGFAPTVEAVARWWDLAALAKRHEEFLERHEHVLHGWRRRTDTPPQEAYRDYLRVLDSWHRLLGADPRLPARLLPANWPGTRSAAVFRELHERLRDAGAEFVGL